VALGGVARFDSPLSLFPSRASSILAAREFLAQERTNVPRKPREFDQVFDVAPRQVRQECNNALEW
jgi:hypothetical protein